MSSTTTIAGLPYPALTDPPNVPSDMAALAAALDHLVIPKYASAAAQTAANPAPADGDQWYRTDQSQGYIQRGTANYVAGDSWSRLSPSTGSGVALTSNTPLTISNIPQYFKHLRVYLVWAASAGTGQGDGQVNFNGDVSALYNWHFYWANNSSSSRQALDSSTFLDLGGICQGVATLGAYATTTVDIFNYSSTTLTKMVNFQTHSSGGYNSPSSWQSSVGGGVYGVTTAITSMSFTNNAASPTSLSIGSVAYVYGIG